ncbi:MAG: homoserine kinase [Alphaproteobacteria bacterium]|nr:homoserine kinase [Alphaproteobacteria bacterium]
MAVYTQVGDEDLARFVAEYDIGEVVSFAGIAEGVENSNFLVRTTKSSYILTIYEKRVAPQDLPFFVGLMEHLAANGLRCPTPIRARDGEALRRLNGRPAAIVSFLEGLWPRRITAAHCTGVGDALARLHQAQQGFAMRRLNALSLTGWRSLVAACEVRADEVRPGLGAGIKAELAYLEDTWPKDLPEGVIHADLFPDNVFFLGDKLSGLIDFYFACNDFLAYDLAICLNAWCFEPGHAFNVTKARLLATAYQKRRPLSAVETRALPVLCRGSALRFLLTRLYDWLNHPEGALVRPKDPLEYWAKLQFHQRIGGPEGYGLDPA